MLLTAVTTSQHTLCHIAWRAARGLTCGCSRQTRESGDLPDYPDMGGTVHQRSVVRVGATLIVASLALTACGSRSGNDSGGSSGGSTKTAKIGVIAPLSGDLSALGLGIQHSVELAVKQANDSNAIPGWKLEVSAKDDEAKPDVGKNAATSLSSDTDVIGVVGTLNSSVALQVQPVLAPKNIVQISPANTNPSLTKG